MQSSRRVFPLFSAAVVPVAYTSHHRSKHHHHSSTTTLSQVRWASSSSSPSSSPPPRYLSSRRISTPSIIDACRERGILRQQESSFQITHHTTVIDATNGLLPITSSCYLLTTSIPTTTTHNNNSGGGVVLSATLVGLGEFVPQVPPIETATAIYKALSCRSGTDSREVVALKSIIMTDFHPYAPTILSELLRLLHRDNNNSSLSQPRPPIELHVPSSRVVAYLSDSTRHHSILKAILQNNGILDDCDDNANDATTTTTTLRDSIIKGSAFVEGLPLLGSSASSSTSVSYRLKLISSGVGMIKLFDANAWLVQSTAKTAILPPDTPHSSNSKKQLEQHIRALDRSLITYLAHLNRTTITPELYLKRDTSVISEEALQVGHASVVCHDVGVGHMYVGSLLGSRGPWSFNTLLPRIHNELFATTSSALTTAPSSSSTTTLRPLHERLLDQPGVLLDGGVGGASMTSQVPSDVAASVKVLGQHASFVKGVLALSPSAHRFEGEAPIGLVDRLLQSSSIDVKGEDSTPSSHHSSSSSSRGFITQGDVSRVFDNAVAISESNLHTPPTTSGSGNNGLDASVPVTVLFGSSYGDLCTIIHSSGNNNNATATTGKKHHRGDDEGMVSSKGRIVSGGLITPSIPLMKFQSSSTMPTQQHQQQVIQRTPFEVLEELAVSISTIKAMRGGSVDTKDSSTTTPDVSKLVCFDGDDGGVDHTRASTAQLGFANWVKASLIRQLEKKTTTTSTHVSTNTTKINTIGGGGGAKNNNIDVKGAPSTRRPTPSEPRRAHDDDDVWVPNRPLSSRRESQPTSRGAKSSAPRKDNYRPKSSHNPTTTARHVDEF